MTEGQIGFYKGAYPCGFMGLNEYADIKMSLFTRENEEAMNIHTEWVEFPLYTVVQGNFSVYGTKARCVRTKDYGQRSLYAYETPTPYFGDIGEGIIAEDGLCYVAIDPVFSQCVSLEGYQVFLQAYGAGEIQLQSRHADHFVVTGTPGLSFGWEVKAKQIDFDQLRMEEDRGLANIKTTNYGKEAAQYRTALSEGRITA